METSPKESVEILRQKYDDCDFNRAHISPNGMYCLHCHRRLEYLALKSEKLLARRKELKITPPLKQFEEEDLRRREITFQKFNDLFRGLYLIRNGYPRKISLAENISFE